MRTRSAILAAARGLVSERGFGGLSMQEVARRAGVALDTVYAAVGRKPTLLRLVIETAISGGDAPVDAEERGYVRRIREAPRAADKLAIYAGAVREIHARLGPIVRALREASAAHPELAALWDEIAARRAANMRKLARDLCATGEVRADLGVDRIADVIWATGSPEMYLLFVGDRGWTPAAYESWLSEAWTRLLLTDA